MAPLEDILAPNLDVLIVGFNPSLVSWRRGHHYANPVNNFYRLLHSSGLTPRLLSPDEDGLLPQFGIGLTNLVLDVPSAHEGEVPARAYRAGRDTLTRKVLDLQPLVVSFNGIRIYQYYYGKKPLQLGEQPERIGSSRVYVTPSSSGAANALIRERAALYRGLKELVDLLKREEQSV